MNAVVGWMQPHDHSEARHTLSLLVGVAVAVTIVTAPVSAAGASHASPWLLGAAGAALVLCAVVALVSRLMSQPWPSVWLVCPLLAVAAITLSGVATADVSVGAQVFYIFCAVWGGALLTPRGATVMAGVSILGEAVLVGTQLPPPEALTDTAYLGATIATISYLLSRATSRNRRAVAGLSKRASTDSLTGLVNRAGLDEALARIAGVPDPAGTAMIVIDVDRFKLINDQFGHPVGDRILIHLAHILETGARRDDVVCRLGGDELAVLLPGCSAPTAHRRALDIVESVRVSHLLVLGAGTVRVSVSAGVAHCPSGASEPGELYDVADAALYRAKRAGRDQVAQHPA